MRRVLEWPTWRGLPQPSFSKEAAHVRDGLCPAGGYSPTGVRHHRCANRLVPKLGGPHKARDAVSPDEFEAPCIPHVFYGLFVECTRGCHLKQQVAACHLSIRQDATLVGLIA